MAYIDIVQRLKDATAEPSPDNVQKACFADLMRECKAIGVERIRTELVEQGVQNGAFCAVTGLSKSYASHFLKGTHKHRLMPGCLEAIIKNYIPNTVHNLFFGEDKPLYLPRYLCEMMTAVCSLPETKRNKLKQYIKETYGAKLKDYSPLVDNPAELCIERLREYADCRGFTAERVFTTVVDDEDSDYPSMVDPYLTQRKFIPHDIFFERKDRGNAKEFGTLRIMMVSVVLGVPLDYLMCKDYTTWSELWYFNTKASKQALWEPLTSPEARYVLRSYLQLPDEESRRELYYYVVTGQINRRNKSR